MEWKSRQLLEVNTLHLAPWKMSSSLSQKKHLTTFCFIFFPKMSLLNEAPKALHLATDLCLKWTIVVDNNRQAVITVLLMLLGTTLLRILFSKPNHCYINNQTMHNWKFCRSNAVRVQVDTSVKNDKRIHILNIFETKLNDILDLSKITVRGCFV